MGVDGDEEHVPFLHKDDAAENTISGEVRPSTRARRIETLRHCAHWTAHLLLIFLLFMLFETQILKKRPLRPFLRPAEEAYSDVPSILEFEMMDMEPRDPSGLRKDESWIGPPNGRNHKQWWDLTHVGVVSITEEEQIALDMETSRANATGEYFVVPQVYHDLHCLKKMREAFWGVDLEHNLDEKGRMHMDHCIDLIRRNLMCNADLSPYPFHWGGDKHRADYNIQRRCRNWDNIHTWAKGRNTTGYVL